ncbi:hypothetical protein EHQ81_00950 [Leptospira selangorensis]|uniref:Lipoprotein n=1 Tax=Leptospira selangorensis TaxID=2484982 RepID=A0A4R9FNQ2_9LEPT|nr:hypothetical protein [Leptospira selangorensis]TGK00362.1 hypothetical protein EHO58_18020 [Leptospira selangorensis]TGM17109.1 hypothetical protein EHQ81_00950 [Leptospira selangorensis]TGM21447.1 hypothetical protein EHQ82_10695 [Leptospira selangorensis]
MELKRIYIFLLCVVFSGCYSKTIFFFQNIRMRPLPPQVEQSLYKQNEKGCNENIRNILKRIPEKNPTATHIRDLEIFQYDQGMFDTCYRLYYGLEISQ